MGKNKKNTGVQMLRAVLFIGVVAFHCGTAGSQFFWGGIESFFLISSFFLTKSLIKKDASELNVLSTVKHRFSRLIPQYYLVLIGAFLLTIVLYQKLPVADFLYHLLFSQNINWMVTGYQSDLAYVTAHTWTLSIEAYLFLIWLFAFKCIKNRRSRIAFNLVLMAVAIAYRTVTTITIGDAMITSLFPIAHADTFAIGSMMAMLDGDSLQKRSKNRNKAFIACILIGVILIFASICVTASMNNVSILDGYKLYKSSRYYLNNAFTCNVYLFIALISAALLHFSKLLKVSCKPLVQLGNLSYTGYLVHYPFKIVCGRLIENEWLLFAIVLCATVIVSVLIDSTIKHLRIGKLILGESV